MTDSVQSSSGTDRIVLAQCTASKRDGEHAARNLYDESDSFVKQRAYCEANADRWFVQSAEYGLLHPDDVVPSYNTHAKDLDDPEAWGERIAADLASRVPAEAVVEILGGAKYADPLTPALERRGFEVKEPLRGQGIGKRKEDADGHGEPEAGGVRVRIYLGGLTRPEMKKCHQIAPSHIFGGVWTPHDRSTPNEIPFIVDNGAYTKTFDPDEWTDLLDRLSEYNYGPDFVVLPDEYNDAEGTLERHRQYVSEVLDRHLTPAAVVQPGMPVETQVSLADHIGAEFVFVGGQNLWKRARGQDIVEAAHERGLRVHIGNPGGEDGLTWAYKIRADSADTSTITQNGYWHYLEQLEEITEDHSKGDPLIKSKQSAITDSFVTATDGGNGRSVDTGTDHGGPER